MKKQARVICAAVTAVMLFVGVITFVQVKTSTGGSGI